MGIVRDMKFLTSGALVELGDSIMLPDISVYFGLVTCCIIVFDVALYCGGSRMLFVVEAIGSREQIDTTSKDSVVYTIA